MHLFWKKLTRNIRVILLNCILILPIIRFWIYDIFLKYLKQTTLLNFLKYAFSKLQVKQI